MSVDREAGTNPETIGAQARKINNWMDRAEFELGEGQDLDRLISKEMETLRDFIDPTLSAKVNYRRFKRKLGLKTKSDRIKERRDAADQQKARAKDAIYANLDAIEAGDPEDIMADVAAEYGREYAEECLEAARFDRAGEDRAIAESQAPAPAEASPNTPEPAPVEATASEPAPASHQRPTGAARWLARLPGPVKTACIVLYLLLCYRPDYSESTGVSPDV